MILETVELYILTIVFDVGHQIKTNNLVQEPRVRHEGTRFLQNNLICCGCCFQHDPSRGKVVLSSMWRLYLPQNIQTSDARAVLFEKVQVLHFRTCLQGKKEGPPLKPDQSSAFSRAEEKTQSLCLCFYCEKNNPLLVLYSVNLRPFVKSSILMMNCNYIGLIVNLCLTEMFLFFPPATVNKWVLWHTLVSLDSYIANQSSFSSINDKDLHYYKNLRNLWVFKASITANVTTRSIKE